MPNRESVELVKEQLRIKKAELKKTGAEKNRQEVKIKHLLAITSKKINTLQQQLNEKNEQLRFQKSVSYQRSTIATSSKKEEASTKGTKGTGETSMWGTPELDMVEQINRMLKELRDKNNRLTQKIEEERKARERLIDEKGVLAREINRLQIDPKAIQPKKIKSAPDEPMEDDSRERFEQLIKEKEDLIKTYENLLDGDFEEGDESQFPAEIVKQGHIPGAVPWLRDRTCS